jgi:glucose-1-phosphate cytidylyltransferase
MKVVILCGGKGTRIRGVNDDLPKPMIPIGPYPIIWHIMRSYAYFGFKDFVLCLGYKGLSIKEFFLNYQSQISDFTIDFSNGRGVSYDKVHEKLDWKVTLAETGENTLTGSRVKRIEHYIEEDEDFMLTYGDGVSNIDVHALAAYHKNHGKLVTVSGVRPPSRFGELDNNEHGQVIEFNEKPQAVGGRISGGFLVCKRGVLDYLDDGRSDEIFEADPMRRIAADGQMMMYKHDGFWQCMDTFRDYALLNKLYETGTAPWVNS